MDPTCSIYWWGKLMMTFCFFGLPSTLEFFVYLFNCVPFLDMKSPFWLVPMPLWHWEVQLLVKNLCDSSGLTIGNDRIFTGQASWGNLSSPHQIQGTSNALQSQKQCTVKDSGLSGLQTLRILSFLGLQCIHSCLSVWGTGQKTSSGTSAEPFF